MSDKALTNIGGRMSRDILKETLGLLVHPDTDYQHAEEFYQQILDTDAALRADLTFTKDAIDIALDSRDQLLRTFTIWAAEFQQGKMALREVGGLRAQLTARTQERDEALAKIKTEQFMNSNGQLLLDDLKQQLAASEARVKELEAFIAREND